MMYSINFFFSAPTTSEIYTLSLHDALPISSGVARVTDVMTVDSEKAKARELWPEHEILRKVECLDGAVEDRKSTRLNSSHGYISYAVFCLKKKKNRK